MNALQQSYQDPRRSPRSLRAWTPTVQPSRLLPRKAISQKHLQHSWTRSCNRGRSLRNAPWSAHRTSRPRYRHCYHHEACMRSRPPVNGKTPHRLVQVYPQKAILRYRSRYNELSPGQYRIPRSSLGTRYCLRWTAPNIPSPLALRGMVS